MEEIIIDPRLRFNYASYYLLGMNKVFGRRAIVWDVAPFQQFSYAKTAEYHNGFHLLYGKEQGNRLLYKKIYIDFNDPPVISQNRYEWCDIYAKINVKEEDLHKYSKLMPIGPSFGVNLYSYPHLLWRYLLNVSKSHHGTNFSPKMMLRDYLYSKVRRKKFMSYQENDSQKDYVFHLSTLWYDNQTFSTTNKYRGGFIRACKKYCPNFEGGFFYIPGVEKEFPQYTTYLEEYKDCLIFSRIPMKEYLAKTKKSAIAFNTPSVCGCFGWKMGEYLAMGKAIISMPLNGVMPDKGLRHGIECHFVNSEDEIDEAVKLLLGDEAYRRQLEKGARAYFEKYLAPDAVIRRILRKADEL